MEHLKLSFHFSFWLALCCSLVFKSSALFFCYTMAMLLHECSHYFVASKLHYQCTQIQLSVFGAVLYGDFVYASKQDNVLIALAGPCANLIAIVCCVALWWIAPTSYLLTMDFVSANLGMATVNLLPAYPLDGGKVLCGILENVCSKTKALRIVKTVTLFVAIGLFLIFAVGIFYGYYLYSLALFSAFLLSGYFAKGKAVYIRRSFMQNYLKRMVKGVEKKTLVFDTDATVSAVAKRMIGGSLYDVELWHDGKLVKKFTFYQLDAILKQSNPNQKLADIVASKL